MTELALTVERLQNQNLEKDRVNKDLTEKLEALVRCSCPRGVVGRMGYWPDPWTQAEGQAVGAPWSIPLRQHHPSLIEQLVCARLSVSTLTSFIPFYPLSSPITDLHYTEEKPQAPGEILFPRLGLGSSALSSCL